MTTFIEFLEEIDQSKQAVILPPADVERLVARFGSSVRSMGFWNKTGDGSVEIPMSNITEAARTLGGSHLSEAVLALRSPSGFADVLDDSSARQLIEALSNLYLEQFEDRVKRFQNTSDDAEAGRLWHEIANDLFGA
jgi:hypothetical protein